MIRMKRFLAMAGIVLMLFGLALYAGGCSGNDDGLKEFTLEELAKFDGMDGRSAYIAYDGMVYDVTDSELWESGTHFDAHQAGQDLTEFMKDAPHTEEILIENFTVVGKLVE